MHHMPTQIRVYTAIYYWLTNLDQFGISHPKIAFRSIQNLHSHAEDWIVRMINAHNSFSSVRNEGALNRWKTHDYCLSNFVSKKEQKLGHSTVTFFTGSFPTSLSSATARGTGDNGPSFEAITLLRLYVAYINLLVESQNTSPRYCEAFRDSEHCR